MPSFFLSALSVMLRQHWFSFCGWNNTHIISTSGTWCWLFFLEILSQLSLLHVGFFVPFMSQLVSLVFPCQDPGTPSKSPTAVMRTQPLETSSATCLGAHEQALGLGVALRNHSTSVPHTANPQLANRLYFLVTWRFHLKKKGHW